MWEVVQANGTWIVLGIAFLLMMRMHGGGMGCGAGHGGHNETREPAPPAGTAPPSTSDQTPRQPEEIGSASGRYGSHRH